jgi:hypothetical protein
MYESSMNTDILERTQRRLELAASPNAAATKLFPTVAEHCEAFIERQQQWLYGGEKPALCELNPTFWAMTVGSIGRPATPIVYSKSENTFRRYTASSGLFEQIPDSRVLEDVLSNLSLCAEFFPAGTSVNLKHNPMRRVIQTAKDVLAVDENYFKDGSCYHLPLINGVLELGGTIFTQHSPSMPVRDVLPVKYDPTATCERFRDYFLGQVLHPDDISLVQRYCSQMLTGQNHSQTILVLTGETGWGKSTLMKIVGTIIGWERAGILTEQLFTNPSEVGHYSDKNFLYHPDMPADYLQRKDASIMKQLVGGDPIWIPTHKGRSKAVLLGRFPVVMACNGRPRIQ